ncbi:MAG: ABC transporter permease [Lachnospiraceae bacterium]|nr:ABC transporter permease [Lachnospiraceae bacterium]
MFARLAFRNVKRQIGNYMIYFLTVTLTVALMFAVNNLIFSSELKRFSDMNQSLKDGLIVMSMFIALIVSFVLGYATSFMLKLRKREFGTYLTMGMTRKNILFIFVLETMIMSVAALIIGIFLGLFIYQGIMAVFANLLEIDFEFSAYSSGGLLFTIALVCIMFLLASVTSAIYLKRVSIYNLIHGEKKVEKGVRYPALWQMVSILSFAGLILCLYYFNDGLDLAYTNVDRSSREIFGSLAGAAVCLVLFHIGLARSAVHFFMRNKKFCCRGTNTFTIRQLSGKLSSNSVIIGILAFLIGFAVILVNVTFVQKVSERVGLDKSYPFDINAAVGRENKQAISIPDGIRIIEKYQKIKTRIEYQIYDSGSDYFYGFTPWSGKGYEGITDAYMKESDYNILMEALGRERIECKDGFYLLAASPHIAQFDFSKAVLEQEGKEYHYLGIIEDVPFRFWGYFIILVPDRLVSSMDVESDCVSIDLEKGSFDVRSMQDELSYVYDQTGTDDFAYFRSDFDIKEYARVSRNETSAVLVVGAIYMAVIFVFLAMAVLALKTLAGLSEDKRKYEVLFRLGTSERQQEKTLFYQIFSFFFLPFALPLLLSIPTGWFCVRIMRMTGLGHLKEIYFNTGMIAVVLTAVYVLYFFTTYLISKRNTVYRI